MAVCSKRPNVLALPHASQWLTSWALTSVQCEHTQPFTQDPDSLGRCCCRRGWGSSLTLTACCSGLRPLPVLSFVAADDRGGSQSSSLLTRSTTFGSGSAAVSAVREAPRRRAGARSEAACTAAADGSRGADADVDAPNADVVAPLFRRGCVACHNDTGLSG